MIAPAVENEREKQNPVRFARTGFFVGKPGIIGAVLVILPASSLSRHPAEFSADGEDGDR